MVQMKFGSSNFIAIKTRFDIVDSIKNGQNDNL